MYNIIYIYTYRHTFTQYILLGIVSIDGCECGTYEHTNITKLWDNILHFGSHLVVIGVFVVDWICYFYFIFCC